MKFFIFLTCLAHLISFIEIICVYRSEVLAENVDLLNQTKLTVLGREGEGRKREGERNEHGE